MKILSYSRNPFLQEFIHASDGYRRATIIKAIEQAKYEDAANLILLHLYPVTCKERRGFFKQIKAESKTVPGDVNVWIGKRHPEFLIYVAIQQVELGECCSALKYLISGGLI